jgi:hypothetical protein
LIRLSREDKSSTGKWTKESVENFRNTIEDLMMIRSILRHYSPDFNISNTIDAKQIKRLMKRAAKSLLPLFEIYKLYEEKVVDSGQQSINDSSNIIKTGIELIQTIGQDIVFVGSNNVKKILKNLGIDANKIIVAGGPMHINDLKELNPSITTEALENYQKKIQAVVNILKKTVESGKIIKFAMAIKDKNDQQIAIRMPEIEHQIGMSMPKIMVQTWDKI